MNKVQNIPNRRCRRAWRLFLANADDGITQYTMYLWYILDHNTRFFKHQFTANITKQINLVLSGTHTK